MERKVTTIPATISRATAMPLGSVQKRKVAAYARVSTDQEEQLTSYEAQVDYYTNYIRSRDDWEFVGVYADQGITGCNTKHREGFRKMVEDALAGKISLIITKSVSRFARNTVDSLSTIRKLKANNVECYFEKENIWSSDSRGELLLTIMSSLAQEESRSISENCIWGQRKKFADGRFSLAYSTFLGYDKGENGELVINEEQAKIIRHIYGLFLQGKSPFAIARQLTNEGIRTPMGKAKWCVATVQSILANEKYSGRALLQKTYTSDYLTKKIKKNHGEVQQYFVEDSHPAIIDKKTFDTVQLLIAARKAGKNRQSCVSIFSSKIKCGECGAWYGAKIWHSNDRYRRVIWQCNHKFKGDKCRTPHLDETAIKELFLKAVNKLCGERKEIIASFNAEKDRMFDTSKLETERADLEQEIAVIVELMQKAISENARVAQNQEEYERKYHALEVRYDGAKDKLAEVKRLITDKQARNVVMERFLGELEKQEAIVTEFTEEMWLSMVDFMTVYSKEDVRITFKNGTEIKA